VQKSRCALTRPAANANQPPENRLTFNTCNSSLAHITCTTKLINTAAHLVLIVVILLCFLVLIIHLGLTHSEIMAQGLLFFLGGFEQTSNTLSFLAYHLAMDSDCQDKVIQEIDDVMKAEVWLLRVIFILGKSAVLRLVLVYILNHATALLGDRHCYR